ncbi:valine--tRNA ligase [Candidatus Wolfebacteria bacterium RIFOXYB1_FULL_54_12]|uniref:Valine--tRNA ligase n=1 Tax=Candidatus Wolfebacteria bacterium RIFOXYB1_FULL_54_12 TaxID=1802559 RepID=A0A1F8DWB2_9BACT|nr:MAG: valine--tRNA ligase [Candidatus Wolfebacteria bacterium RIFOXYB1_FULL_54_12]
MNEIFNKPYEAKEFEQDTYKRWEESGFFNPDNLPESLTHTSDLVPRTFCIIMPPPNANGHLHAGHALFITVEDIMTRYKRMQGYKALWVPGADHAGFETQVVYEKKLEKEGRSRFKMDPQELFDEIMAFTLENKKHMEEEVKRMGASCDWSRERFTLDPDIIKDVQKTFVKMYDDGLAYRGLRTVNWCTKHQTSLSDVETESVEKTDKLYYIKYGPFVVATVRPETIFGDVAIAVNPEDARYRQYIGQEVEVENPNGKLTVKVIGDESVDIEFGTGALKVTPAHDNNDFALAQKHGLEHVIVIDQFGKLNEKAGKYAGMKIAEARTKVVEDLQAMGLIEKIEEYVHAVPTCYKCGTTIEPRLLPQWFVKMKPLAEMAAKVVDEGKIEFIPDNYRKIFLYWMNNTIDWNISRQIVWGIPIPAKVCDDCNFGTAEDIEVCPECGSQLRKDTDTFDTWFSSGQWPLLTLNYPDGKDFKQFYPTDVMETGRDLIFKWVPRMVIFGLYLAKEIPFKTVYMHGLVNDAKGKKMSKSKGNVVNPIELIEKFGTDALRMGLVVGNTPGNDAALAENKIKGYRNFANKIWQATRFVLMNSDGVDFSQAPELTGRDKEVLAECAAMKGQITKELDDFMIHLAAENIYHYFWHTFADKIIEENKDRLKSDNEADKYAAQYVLNEILRASLKLLHPFMPFVTETIYGNLPGNDGKMLMIEKW